MGFGWAIASLAIGIAKQYRVKWFSGPEVAMIVVGSWALLPPIFFWADWVFFFEHVNVTDPVQAALRDIAKHSHDLARNIWLGLLAILYVLFALKLPGVG